MDRFTETTNISYLQNIGNSFKGILLGLVFLIGSIILLWWNEGRSVEQTAALNEMQSEIVTLPDTKFDPSYEGKAVLVQGEVKPLHKLEDTMFGVQSNGLTLHRNVDMYQWKEKTHTESKDKLGGGTETITTYEYVKEWSSFPVDSASFKHSEGHHNPPMNYKSETFTTDAQIGDFHLDKNIIGHVSASESFQGLATMPEYINGAQNYKSYLYISIDSNKSKSVSSPATPKVGDIKISYTFAPAGIYTFAAKAQKNALTSYTTENGKNFVFIRDGRVNAQTIFKQEHDANTTLTWILRAIGLVVMFLGFSMMMGILSTLAKVIPFLGSLVGGITGIAAGVLTLLVGSLVIALAWFSARPMLSLAILGIAGVIAFAVIKLGKREEVTSVSDAK